ncbi:Oidioi.mRNA.OKI2018_I69.chr2.g6853.t1.cds [Oikopleura dioica]|uniref:Oidioi.mRNA.OKI2018_I69.chr2.g6853.t1.cds n=1 Tax=Oikopleura dioica TaxID=34765 RepID=A0ABN7T4Z9_OIKDI|nr:Oidioi.mRNA.OKI2018_I69.chr2.g6853.t1.cds [Oikopleura dioica]
MADDKRQAFNVAMQDAQNAFYDIFVKLETMESDSQMHADQVKQLREDLHNSEKIRMELCAKYSNLRVKYERLRTSIKEAMTLNSPTPDLMARLGSKVEADLNSTRVSSRASSGSVSDQVSKIEGLSVDENGE